jgi:hypothetical protein
MALSIRAAAVSGEEPDMGILRVDSFTVPREVAPNSVFPVTIDVLYNTHDRPGNGTIRAAIYHGNINFTNPIWQSDPTFVTIGGDEIWHVNLTAPPTEGDFKITVCAYFLDQGAWRFFNNTINGPSFKEAIVTVGKTANLDVQLGVAGVPVTIGNSTLTTSPNGEAQTNLFVGTKYDVSIAAIVEFRNSTRMVFNGWKDGNGQNQRTLLIDGNVMLVGSYRTQYALQAYMPGSTRLEWYDAGSNAELQAPSSIPMNWPLDLFGLKYTFVGWTGDVKTSSLKFDVAMNQPKTVIANYSADYSPLILPIAITLAVVGSATVLLLRPRHTPPEIPNKSELMKGTTVAVCSGCGEPVENDWTFCNNCGSELAISGPISKHDEHEA